MDAIYAIGDIHGHLGLARAALRLVEEDQASAGGGDAPVVFVGDLVDRGPDSRGVIDWLIAGLAEHRNWHVLKGNHDRMMACYLEQPSRRDPGLRPDYDWLHPRIGGRETLRSYGLTVPMGATVQDEAVHARARAAVPDIHNSFLAGLETVFVTPDVVVVHAGIRPCVPIENQAEDDLLWIRRAFTDSSADHGQLIVHGHTPVDAVTHYGNRVNIDTGAAYGGRLSAVVIEGRKVWQLTEDGRIPVRPAR